MTTIWKDGGDCGGEYRGIVDEDETYIIARVRIRRGVLCSPALNPARPWPEGEANFRLIRNAPRMLEALEAIRHQADLMMEIRDGSVDWTDWQVMGNCASAAIAATKGDEEK